VASIHPLQHAVRTCLAKARLATPPYNVNQAMAELTSITPDFIPPGTRVDIDDYEGGISDSELPPLIYDEAPATALTAVSPPPTAVLTAGSPPPPAALISAAHLLVPSTFQRTISVETSTTICRCNKLTLNKVATSSYRFCNRSCYPRGRLWAFNPWGHP